MLLLVLSFNTIGTHRDPALAANAPLTRLFEAGLALQGARRIDDLAERILAETRTLFRFDEMYLVLIDRERRMLDIRVHERNQVRLPARLKPIDSGLFGWLVSRWDRWSSRIGATRRRSCCSEPMQRRRSAARCSPCRW